MSSSALRIGFVGGGFITGFHIQSLVEVREVEVAGIASPSGGERCAELARRLGVGPTARPYADAEELAADPTVDAIWVCGRNDTRLATLEKIRAGNTRRARPLRGICLEKPLARTLGEALQVQALVDDIGVPTGYLEDMLFAPTLQRGKEVLWRRGAGLAGRPYLARAAEEHGGPHSKWFWQPEIAGGGVLLDMMCHSLEAARWLLTEPGRPRASLTPFKVRATTANLKWIQPEYAAQLRERFGADLDWAARPSEDFASATVHWRTEDGREVLTETTSSWCYVGAGLRHTFELLGPEYSLAIDMSRCGVEVFFSRRVSGEAGEDLVEKQNAEQGLMPISPNEPAHYGYAGENRHFARSFLAGSRPALTAADGVEVMRVLMAAYRSSEEGRAVDPADPALESFVPAACRAAAHS